MIEGCSRAEYHALNRECEILYQALEAQGDVHRQSFAVQRFNRCCRFLQQFKRLREYSLSVCRDTILGLRLTCWMGLVESSSSKFVIYTCIYILYTYQIISHLRNVQGKTHRGTGKNSARPWTLDDRQACKQVTVPIKHRIWTQTGKDPNKRSIISFPLRGHLQRFGIPQSRPTYSDLQELRLWRFGEWLGWHHGYLGSTWWCWDFHGSRSEHRCRGEPLHQF